jgi:hypothetical protein
MKRLESNGDTKRHRGLTLRALRCKTNLMCCLERNENPRSPTWTSMDGNGYSSTFECVCVCFGMCPESGQGCICPIFKMPSENQVERFHVCLVFMMPREVGWKFVGHVRMCTWEGSISTAPAKPSGLELPFRAPQRNRAGSSGHFEYTSQAERVRPEIVR